MPKAAASPRGIGWRMAIPAITVAMLGVLTIYSHTGISIVSTWVRSATFAHGFVVIPIVLWLVWRVRAQLTILAPRPNWCLLGLSGTAGFGWLLGELGSVNVLSQLGLVATLILTVPGVLGTKVARQLSFPLSFLCFALPSGEFMVPQLMEWTADFVVLGLEAAGIPVYREGLQFAIPSGTWSVVEACSGMRYLIASLMLGTLYGYLSFRSLRRRVMFVCVSVVVPILANWVRACAIVMMGHFSGNALARGVDHLIYGWVFFGVVIAIILWVGAGWREGDPPPSLDGAQSVVPKEKGGEEQLLLAVGAVMLMAGLWRIGLWTVEHSSVTPRVELLSFGTLGGWPATKGKLTDWEPGFRDPSTERHYSFNKDGRAMGLYVGYYHDQTHGQEMVGSGNSLVRRGETKWTKVHNETRTVEIAPQRLSVRTAELLATNGERLIVWQWYWINGRLTASDLWAKVYTVLARLSRKGDASAVVIVYAPKYQAQGAEPVLDAFVRDVGPSVAAMLDETIKTDGHRS